MQIDLYNFLSLPKNDLKQYHSYIKILIEDVWIWPLTKTSLLSESISTEKQPKQPSQQHRPKSAARETNVVKYW